MSKLWIVDDDFLTCELLATAAEVLFGEIESFTEAASFLAQPVADDDVILLDLQMPGIDGIEAVRLLANKGCGATLVLISGYDESVLRSARELARDLGLNVEANLTKPIGIAHLTELLQTILQNGSGSNASRRDSGSKDKGFIPSHADLLEAIEQHQLVLHYQPQLSLKTSTLVGLEALVRWEHPEHGLIYPDRFIELAETTGLIEELTEEVINLAVRQSSLWHEQGYAFKISVNISAQNISNLAMPEYLESLVRKNRLDPKMLVLEITESALMQELTTSLDILTRLRLKGFRLSIDDFGTGFSSLSQLHKIPFTELKIDQSFVMKMLEDPQSHAIVETCIMLGHKLKMSVVAEGVENPEIWQQLKAFGCNIAQGYHISKPLMPDDLIKWYRQIIERRGQSNVTRLHSTTCVY